jgi:protoporphyrinogen oxidase
MAHIGIVGAGMAGLAAAFDLTRRGHQVTIYEAGDALGGLAAGFKDERWDWTLEKFYHHWFEGDRALLQLADEMGVRDRILFPRPKTSFWIDGKIVRSEISPSALFLPLSFPSLVRFGLTGVYLKLTPFWKPLEKYTADEWMRYFMGEEAYGKFFRPLLIGKFSDLYDRVNMAWLWARIKSRSLRLGTYQGGFQAFLDELGRQVQQAGGVIHLRTPVTRIHLEDMKPVLTTAQGAQRFDWVLSTTSPQLMLKLTDRLRETAYGDQMAALTSIGGLCVVLAVKQQLLTDGTYWLNLPARSADKTQNDFPYLALVEHTNYMNRQHYGGDHLLYLGDYCPPDHEYFTLSEDALVARFLPSLKRVNPAFDESWVRRAWVWRAPYAQPVPFVNHSEAIPPLQTPLPGVLWASMSQVYPWDRGTNYAVAMGREAARLIG